VFKIKLELIRILNTLSTSSVATLIVMKSNGQVSNRLTQVAGLLSVNYWQFDQPEFLM
jgi:hypothetical protein